MARSVRPAGHSTDQTVLLSDPSSPARPRWSRVGAGVAGLTLLAGVAACSPATASYSPSSYGSSSTYGSSSSTYGSSTYDSSSSTYGSSTSGTSTYGSPTYGSSTSGTSTYGSSSSGSSTYDSSSSSSSSSGSSSGSSSSSSGASGSPYAGTYTNSDGQQVERPDANSSGATARCKDGTDSHSKHKSGTCSGHGGVAEWL